MALYQNWANLPRLDGIISQENEVSLYQGNQVVLTVDKGVTFGFLKLLYNAELSNNCSILLGVKPRGELSQKIISSENSLLDKDEYDLLVSEQFPSLLTTANQEPPTSNSRQLQNIQQFLNQCQGNFTASQRSLSQLPLSFYSLPSLSYYQEAGISNVQQPLQTIFNAVTTANNNAESTAELAQVNNLQMEACPHSEAEIDLAEAGKTGDNFTTDIEAICQNRIDDQGQVGLNLETKISEVVVESVAEKSSKEVTDSVIDTGHFPYQCDVCHIPFKSKAKFNYHRRRHTEEKPHLCIYCGESFKYFHDLSKHRNELHLCNKTFKCDQCTKSFSSRKELKRHSWRHTGKKTHRCELCGKEYTSEGNLSLHKQKHTGVKQLKCSLCPKMFRHKTVLENHIRNAHTGERPFTCRFCNKGFPTNSQLSSHEKRHSDSKPYVCIECGKSFRQGHILKRHSLLHTDERPYKCHVCSKSFRELSNLQYHKKTHLEKSDRSVICPLCGKTIIIGRGVKRHLKLYHNEICASENDARLFMKSLNPVQKSKKEVLGKEIEAATDLQLTNRGIDATVTCSAVVTDKMPAQEVTDGQSCDFLSIGCPLLTGNDAINNENQSGHVTTGYTNEQDTENQIVNKGVEKPDERHKCKRATFACPMCSREFRGIKTLTNHIKIAHGDCKVVILNGIAESRRAKCKKCSLEFANEEFLSFHIDEAHTTGSCGAGKADVMQTDVREEELAEEDLNEPEVINEGLKEMEVVEVDPNHNGVMGEGRMIEAGEADQEAIERRNEEEITEGQSARGEVIIEDKTEAEMARFNVAEGKVTIGSRTEVDVLQNNAGKSYSNREALSQNDKHFIREMETDVMRPGVKSADMTKLDVKSADMTQADVLQESTPQSDPRQRMQSEIFQSDLTEACGSEANVTISGEVPSCGVGDDLLDPCIMLPVVPQIGLKEASFYQGLSKFGENFNEDDAKLDVAENKLGVPQAAANRDVSSHNNEIVYDSSGMNFGSDRDEASFEVLATSFASTQQRTSTFENISNKKEDDLSSMHNRGLKLTADTGITSLSGERSSSLVHQLKVAKFQNTFVHVLEQRSDTHVHGLDLSNFRDKKIAVAGSEILMHEPPPGFSYAFLPILVPNQYLMK